MVHHSLIVHLKPCDKNVSSSQSVDYYVVMGAQFLQTKDPVLKFCGNCWLVDLARKDPRTIIAFSVHFHPPLINIKALFHVLLFLEKEVTASNKRPPLRYQMNIST